MYREQACIINEIFVNKFIPIKVAFYRQTLLTFFSLYSLTIVNFFAQYL